MGDAVICSLVRGGCHPVLSWAGGSCFRSWTPLSYLQLGQTPPRIPDTQRDRHTDIHCWTCTIELENKNWLLPRCFHPLFMQIYSHHGRYTRRCSWGTRWERGEGKRQKPFGVSRFLARAPSAGSSVVWLRGGTQLGSSRADLWVPVTSSALSSTVALDSYGAI